MPLNYATDIDPYVLDRLDAEGSDHYTPGKRLRAANSAIDWIITALSPVLGERKFPEKMLSELLFTRIWQTSAYGRVEMREATLTAAGQAPIWDIVACYAEPVVIGDSTITPAANEVSLLRSNCSFAHSDFPCKRYSHEQYEDTRRNPLMSGSEQLTGGELRSYYYMIHSYMRTSPNYPTTMWEVQFGPLSLTGKKLVAITHLKRPVDLVSPGDAIPFPIMARELLISRILHYLSIQQGDNTTLNSSQARDTALLMQLLG